jgi:putative FmdB family regulatory protein
MPLYEYKCESCNEVTTHIKTIAEREQPEKEPCPHCGTIAMKKCVGYSGIADSVRIGIRKPDEGFREVLSKIAERVPRSNLKDKLSR